MNKAKDIQEGNKLIAEFMEFEPPKKRLGNKTYYIGQDKDGNPTYSYHTSWDWLMPVVEKIEKYAHVSIQTGGCYISKEQGGGIIDISECEQGTKINTVYKSVVDFIKYHNHIKIKPHE